jgi:hypothetical protein
MNSVSGFICAFYIKAGIFNSHTYPESKWILQCVLTSLCTSKLNTMHFIFRFKSVKIALFYSIFFVHAQKI